MIPSDIPRCHQCQARYVKDTALSNKVYDKNKRNKQSESFYNSSSWKKTREVVLRKYKYLDLYDYYINRRITQTNTVHHIVELSEDWGKRLDLTNLIPLSEANHNKIHGMYSKNKTETQKMLQGLLDRWRVGGT